MNLDTYQDQNTCTSGTGPTPSHLHLDNNAPTWTWISAGLQDPSCHS